MTMTPDPRSLVERLTACAKAMREQNPGRGGVQPVMPHECWLDEAATTITRLTEEVEGPIVPPENGETDPEWRAIRRAIDQFAGRVPTIGKHRAINNAHLAAVVERLDAAGDREAADTIVWQAWHRALDRERERFLLDDARATLARSSDGEC